MGIGIPLYMGGLPMAHFTLPQSSVLSYCTKIEVFPQVIIMIAPKQTNKVVLSLTGDYKVVENNKTDIDELQKALEDAVHEQLMSDVPYGVLLSGGLTIITSALTKKFAKTVESDDKKDAWWPQLHSFSVGLKVRLIWQLLKK